MAVVLVGLAFKGGPKGRAELLLYLALCDHADAQGYCFPGLALLAKKTRQNEKNVRRVLLKLKGWVKVTAVGRGQEYQIDLDNLRRSVLASGCKLTDTEKDFIDSLNADKMSTVDKTSGVPSSPTVDISDPTVDISDRYIENRQEPSIKPKANAASHFSVAMVPETKTGSSPQPDAASVEAIWKLVPKDYRGDKQPACKNIRAAIADLKSQGFADPAETLAERVRNWWADYAKKERAAKANKAFVRNPGDAQGWFNPKTRRRYMSDEAMTPVPQAQDTTLDPLAVIHRQRAQALAEMEETSHATFRAA